MDTDPTAGAQPRRALKGALSGLGALAARHLRRRTYLSLSALDDRSLKDLGLDRSMLLSAAIHGIRAGRRGAAHAPTTDPTP